MYQVYKKSILAEKAQCLETLVPKYLLLIILDPIKGTLCDHIVRSCLDSVNLQTFYMPYHVTFHSYPQLNTLIKISAK